MSPARTRSRSALRSIACTRPPRASAPMSAITSSIRCRGRWCRRRRRFSTTATWTRGRVTMTLGLRFDYQTSSIPAQTLGPGALVPTRNLTLPEIADVPNWKDLSPRLGIAIDLFGNGKTALKASLSRYVITQTTAIASAANPANAPSNYATRTSNDLNADFVPDANLANPLANGELGALSNQNFGKAAGATAYSTDVTNGFGVRTN